MRSPRPPRPHHARAAAARPQGPSQRQLRAGELVRHVLAELFARGSLPDLDVPLSRITITEVRMTPDLKQATVFCAFLGKEGFAAEIKALNEAAARLRGLLGRELTLKFTPALSFREDASFAEGARIDALLRDIRGTEDSGNPSGS